MVPLVGCQVTHVQAGAHGQRLPFSGVMRADQELEVERLLIA